MRLPLGFADLHQLCRFTRDLGAARHADGGSGEAHIIGTAATFYSYNIERPAGHHFDKLGKRTSDIDVVLRSEELLFKMKNTPGAEPDTATVFAGKYVWLRNDGPGGFLAANPALAAFVDTWSRELRRTVDLRLLIAVPGHPSHVDELLRFEPPPIELFPFAGVFPPDPERMEIPPHAIITVSDEELRIADSDGNWIGLPWEQLDLVDIETTADGPVASDVFWVLGSGTHHAVIAHGTAGEDAMVERLTALPGFDHETMIEAMSSTERRVFPCWRKG
jgi:hypothetical protein